MHKDLEKYAGMALQGIMGNSAHYHRLKEHMVEDAVQVAEVMFARLDQLREEHLVAIEANVATLPKTKDGLPIITNSSLFYSLEGTSVKECTISGFLNSYSGWHVTVVFEDGDKITLQQLTGLDVRDLKYVPDKNVWLHMKYEFGGWAIVAVEDAQINNK